jgi:hypothetical protein
MPGSVQIFRWNKVREEAALLVAFDELSNDQIAEKLQIARRSLTDWKNVPEFRARVDDHIAEFRARVRRRGIAIIENRVWHLQRRHDLMNQIIRERSESPEMQDVPGGKTGLIVHQVRGIGKGEDFERIGEYVLDAALLRELREHEKQAAQELGQWADKVDHSGTIEKRVVISLENFERCSQEFESFARQRMGVETVPKNGN